MMTLNSNNTGPYHGFDNQIFIPTTTTTSDVKIITWNPNVGITPYPPYQPGIQIGQTYPNSFTEGAIYGVTEDGWIMKMPDGSTYEFKQGPDSTPLWPKLEPKVEDESKVTPDKEEPKVPSIKDLGKRKLK